MSKKPPETKYPAGWSDERKRKFAEFCKLDEVAENGCFVCTPENVNFGEMPVYDIRGISKRIRELGRELTKEETEEFRIK